ncbi:energy transducer TonB [Sphingobium sp. CCH11-B1]|uniref:energy transducer TonB n=1 Tax=Sphingobium sp. CCH11-B1 TaxID=1768781 RepID=UPI00083290AE
MRLMRLQTTGTDGQSRYGAGRRSPLGLGGTIAVHALLVGGFLLLPKEVLDIVRPTPPIETYPVPADPPPPEITPDQPVDTKVPQPSLPKPQQPTATDPVVTLPSDPFLPGTTDPGDSLKPVDPYVPPPPIQDPVLTEAQIDPRALPGFQPDYPGTMIRQGMEGKVTVRVSISAQGRVTAIEKISATDESFWLATQRHALRQWRFRPATRDGVPVASTKQLTVRFTLTDR